MVLTAWVEEANKWGAVETMLVAAQFPHLRHHITQLLFTGPRGRPMAITSVSRGWDRITDQVYLRKEGFILVHSS